MTGYRSWYEFFEHVLIYSKNHKIETIVICGLLSRFLLFDFVPVNYDTGLYLYDAWRFFQGEIPILDYPSRSPLFHLLLTPIFMVEVSPLVISRIFMVFISMILGVVVFSLAKHVYSRQAGLAAATVFLFTPLTLTFGMWLKTEQVAALPILLAYLVLIKHLDIEMLQFRYSAFAGMLLGIAFLVRRVAIAHVITLILVLVYFRWRHSKHPVSDAILNASLISTGMFGMITLGYLIMAWPRIDSVLFLLRKQLLPVIPIPLSVNTGNVIPLWIVPSYLTGISSACIDANTRVMNLCVSQFLRTAFILSEMVLVALPAFLLLSIYLWDRAYRRFAFEQSRRILELITLVGIVGWAGGLYIGFPFSFPYPGLYLLAVGLVTSVFFFTVKRANVEISNRWPRQAHIFSIAILVVTLGYLQSGRLLAITYLQDVFPFVAILAGITAVSLMERNQIRKVAHKTLIALLLLAFVLSLIGAFFLAAHNGGFVQDYTAGNVRTVSPILTAGGDLQSRTASGEPVLTAQPLYAIEANRPNVADFSRQIWFFLKTPEPNRAARTANTIVSTLNKREIEYVIVERRMQRIMEASPTIRRTIESQYCPVKSPSFEQLGAKLYRHSRQAPNCG